MSRYTVFISHASPQPDEEPESESGELVEVQQKVPAKSEAKEPAERTDDLVRMYLREIGAHARTVRRYHYDSHHQLRQHIQTFLDAYNFAKRLKTLNGLTPFESVCKAWTKEPNRFKYVNTVALPEHVVPPP